jgi:hypothetical protein
MPGFITGKHRRAGIFATAGFLSVVTAVSAAAATIPSGAPGIAMDARATAAVNASTVSISQDDLNFQKARIDAVTRADELAAAAARARAIRLAEGLRAHRIHARRVKAAELAAAAAAAQRAAQARAAAAAAAAQRAQQQQAQQSSSSSGGGYVASGNPEQIAQSMLGQFGWSSSEFSCLLPLWQRESGWNVNASNPGSGAYGIPQALPGSKMASAGPGWQTNPATQIRWGLQYIQSTYGSPCSAWAHEQSSGWY